MDNTPPRKPPTPPTPPSEPPKTNRSGAADGTTGGPPRPPGGAPEGTRPAQPSRAPVQAARPRPKHSTRARGGGAKPPGGRRRRRLLRWAISASAAAILGAGLGLTVAAVIDMPRVDSLADFTPSRITQLYTEGGEPFASYASQRRVVLGQDEIPDLLSQAVIAVEDSNFYQHGGFDAVGVVRAAVTNLRKGTYEEGASTLTMQLARQLFLTLDKKWSRKIEETFLAVEIEKTYSKEQILTLYLNFVYFGHGQYGFEAASRFFFGKSVGELDLAEAATLAGIPQRPNYFSPYRVPDAVKKRRNVVLRRMLDQSFITQEEYEAASQAPLEPIVHQPTERLGPYFGEEVRRSLEKTYGSATLLERGLQVETTLDAPIQRAAESALHDHILSIDHRKGWRGPLRQEEGDLESLDLASWNGTGIQAERWYEGVVLESNQRGALVRIEGETHSLTPEGFAWTRKRRPSDLLERGDVAWFRFEELEDGQRRLHLEQEPEIQGCAVVLESATGAIRALVGGWRFGDDQFNRVLQARRQPGSAFKLFVYGAGLEAGFTPADTLFDAPVFFAGADNELSYSPRNNSRRYYGIVTLRRALEHSMNVSAVKLQDLVGADRIIDFAERSGVTSRLLPVASLALGSVEVSPLEMAAAYAAIANQGTYVEPYLIEKVSTPEGQVLEQRVATTKTVTTPEIAYLLTHMLEGVVDRGTAKAARGLDIDLAGKTGTTNDYTDAWFAGFTPRYTILTWVGYDVKRSLGRGMDGSRAALPIWQKIVEAGLEEGWLQKGERFARPASLTSQAVDYWTGLLPAVGAETLIEEAFLPGTEPIREYEPRWAQIMPLPWSQQRPFYTPKQGEVMPEMFRDLDETEEP